MEEVQMTISADGKVTLHFHGIKADVRHSLAKELERLIGPATMRRHGPPDEEVKARIQQNLNTDKD
jgi:hypothetical protein